MKVLFISPNTERLNMPTLPLGLALVATATRRAGHQTRFLDLLAVPDPLAAVHQAIIEFQPEVIALSIRNVDDQSMQDTKFLLEPVLDVVAVCRAASLAKIVVGGAGYSIFSEAALKSLASAAWQPRSVCQGQAARNVDSQHGWRSLRERTNLHGPKCHRAGFA